MTEHRSAADVIVRLVRDRDLDSTIRRVFGRAPARRIQRRLDPQCLSGFRKDDVSYRILNSVAILPADAGRFTFYDCAYEELLQALGPINDSSIPWTMINDDVHMGFFDIYDQYILNILYDPHLHAGMTAREVHKLLPQVMPSVRAFVAKVNGLR